MTIDQAKKILEKPRFGDPDQIAALQRLRDAEKEEVLRTRLFGRVFLCSDCGMGNKTKECWQCGADAIPVSKELLASWDLDILEGVEEDLLHA
jgi:hypothetical protein